VLRLWTKPWEDADGDLWDQGRVYVQIDGGRWQIEHLHQRVRERYQPLRSPAAAAPEIGDPQTAASPATDSPSVTVPVSPPSPSFGDFPAFNRPLTLPVPRRQ
jgi:conjugal transfer pilus assembly protein TraV